MLRSLAKCLPVAVALAALSGTALAQTPAAAAAPTPVHTVTANVGLFSEYIFRGISQTGGKPALQGGFDYAHASGVYLGTWASNISWLEDFGVYSRSSLEWDVYGGFKNTIDGTEITYDVGLLYYYYPGRRVTGAVKVDTFEAYGSVGWRWISGKLSYTLSDDYFGARPTGQKTRGTMYWEANVTYPILETGVSLLAHYGYLDVDDDASGDAKVGYSDWRLGVSYTIPDGPVKGLEVGAYYSGNDAKRAFYTDFTGYDTSKDRGVVYVKKTF
jgi:uncharacterized protein (TIGR02001 family)